MADYTPVEDGVIDLKDSVQAFLFGAASGGDVDGLTGLVEDVEHNATELIHALRDNQDDTYKGWLETDPLPVPPQA